MKKFVIYLIKNPNDRLYVGQSSNFKSRLESYRGCHCKDQSKLYASLMKHGFDAHEITVIKRCTIETVNRWERFFIHKYDTASRNNLNCTTGGQDYFFHTEETRKRMSEAQKGNTKTLGRKQSKEEISKRKSSRKKNGKTWTKEMRNRASLSQIKRFKTHSHAGAQKCINLDTQEVYDSISHAARSLGIVNETLRKDIVREKFKYRVTYYE